MKLAHIFPAITPHTPTKEAQAKLEGWQKDKEIALAKDLQGLIKKHHGRGIDRKRLHSVLEQAAKMLEKI